MLRKINKGIKKYALENAVAHKGKAQTGSVIGKIIGEFPNAKILLKKIVPKIKKEVKKVNELSSEEQKKQLKKIHPAFFKKKPKKKKKLADLPGAKQGKVVTRMPPEPGKYMTVGHALSFLINYLYAKKYNGKCILRFEDTNPEKPKQEYVNSFKDGITRFLKIKPSKTVYISDHIPQMYRELEKLIKKGNCYICSCSSKKISKLRRKRKRCEHRNKTKKENLDLWKKMLKKKSGEKKYIVRLKGDMKSNNATMRDPVLARINYAKHYRQKNKFCVWPTYDFANTCEEEWCGITHVLRSIEFGKERIELQKHLAKTLGFKEKKYIQYGRFNISGLTKASGRVIKKLIKKGANWDDPQMPTIAAFERRGFVKETFYELAKQVGLSKTPTKIDEKTIAAINRKEIDPIANRYFLVTEPSKLKVIGPPRGKKFVIKMHPDKKKKRSFRINKKFYINKDKLIDNLGNEINLYALYNVLIPKQIGRIGTKVKYTGAHRKKGLKIIQWVPKKHAKINIITKKKKIRAIADPGIKKVKQGDIVQFQDFGFCRLDKKLKKKLVFVFGHK